MTAVVSMATVQDTHSRAFVIENVMKEKIAVMTSLMSALKVCNIVLNSKILRVIYFSFRATNSSN